MNIKLSMMASLCVIFTVAGCSSTPDTFATSEPKLLEKEAGVSGSRVCFSNSTSVPMSAAPAGEPIQGRQDIGPAGAITAQNELCFAGWNSRRYTDWISDDLGKGFFQEYTSDVVVALSIDGAYNALTMRANNVAIARPDFTWTEDPLKEQKWSGGAMSDGAVVQGSVAGHSFTVTRRADTDNFKEFLVQFTQ